MKITANPTALLVACHPALFHVHAQAAGMSVAAKEKGLLLALNLRVSGFEKSSPTRQSRGTAKKRAAPHFYVWP